MGSRASIDDRRKARRFRAQHLAKIVVEPDVMISCTVEDISTDGARISLPQRCQIPDDFDLYIAAHELQVHHVRLCWREAGMIGVAFVKPADRSGQPHVAPNHEADKFRVEIERDETTVPIRLLGKR